MNRSLEPLALLIKQTQHRQNRMMEAALSPLDVSLVQWNALREIDRNSGSSMHRLAELTFNSDQAFGTLTARLGRLGLIKQRPGTGRALITELTARGKSVFDQGYPLIIGVCATFLGSLTEAERRLLTSLLTKVLITESQMPARSKVGARNSLEAARTRDRALTD